MKRKLTYLTPFIPWLLFLLGVDAFSAFLLWLSDAQAFYSVMGLFVLATLVLFTLLCAMLIRKEEAREQAFLDYLSNPSTYTEEQLLRLLTPAEGESIQLLSQTLAQKTEAYTQLQEQLKDYEEYVESWVHETKTPLSLLTLLLDNRRDELPESILFKLDYIRNRMQEAVDQMLFYARLKSARKDYLFEPICLQSCIEEVLEDYKPLLDEKEFIVDYQVTGATVYCDRRGLRFILGQVVSNAIKYCSDEPFLRFSFISGNTSSILYIADNGIGVRSCDLPYIFEKGFTGDSGDGRKKATGMGLYLSNGIAKEMNLSMEANSTWQKGFELQIVFPVVENPK